MKILFFFFKFLFLTSHLALRFRPQLYPLKTALVIRNRKFYELPVSNVNILSHLALSTRFQLCVIRNWNVLNHSISNHFPGALSPGSRTFPSASNTHAQLNNNHTSKPILGRLEHCRRIEFN